MSDRSAGPKEGSTPTSEEADEATEDGTWRTAMNPDRCPIVFRMARP